MPEGSRIIIIIIMGEEVGDVEGEDVVAVDVEGVRGSLAHIMCIFLAYVKSTNTSTVEPSEGSHTFKLNQYRLLLFE